MPKVLVTFAFCGLAVAFACGDTSGPRAGLNIVSGAGVSDTVLSTFKPPLTVQLLDGDRQPMSGQTVYFNTDGFVLAAPIDDPGFVTDRLPVITNASGDASVWLEAKQWAAQGKVVVEAPSGQSTTTLPWAAHCFASSHTDASPLALVITGRRSVTNPGSSIGAANTKPFVLKYTVWPDIGWRFPSRSWTVSGGLKVESTVSDTPAPDTIFRPAWGPLVSPHAARPNARLRMRAPRPRRRLATTIGGAA